MVGIDDINPMKGRDIVLKICLPILLVFVLIQWLRDTEADTRPQRYRHQYQNFTANELGQGEIQTAAHECAICLEEMLTGTAVRILPCRHAFHHDCVNHWLAVRNKTTTYCPMCKFDLQQHFEEQHAAKIQLNSYNRNDETSWMDRARRRLHCWKGPRANGREDSLLEEEGDLELSIEESISTGSEHTSSLS